MRQLAEIMAAERSEDWGQTKFRHWYTGHIHRDRAEESIGGVTSESLRTIASRDAWAASMGYKAGRDMKCDVWHKDHGRVCRHIVGIEQLRAA